MILSVITTGGNSRRFFVVSLTMVSCKFFKKGGVAVKKLVIVVAVLLMSLVAFGSQGNLGALMGTKIFKGCGITRSEAIDDLKRRAIEYAIGSEIESITVVRNGLVDKDEVVSYVSGIAKVKSIVGETNENGLYCVKGTVEVLDTKKLENVFRKLSNKYRIAIDIKERYQDDQKCPLPKNVGSLDVLKAVFSKFGVDLFSIKGLKRQVEFEERKGSIVGESERAEKTAKEEVKEKMGLDVDYYIFLDLTYTSEETSGGCFIDVNEYSEIMKRDRTTTKSVEVDERDIYSDPVVGVNELLAKGVPELVRKTLNYMVQDMISNCCNPRYFTVKFVLPKSDPDMISKIKDIMDNQIYEVASEDSIRILETDLKDVSSKALSYSVSIISDIPTLEDILAKATKNAGFSTKINITGEGLLVNIEEQKIVINKVSRKIMALKFYKFLRSHKENLGIQKIGELHKLLNGSFEIPVVVNSIDDLAIDLDGQNIGGAEVSVVDFSDNEIVVSIK